MKISSNKSKQKPIQEEDLPSTDNKRFSIYTLLILAAFSVSLYFRTIVPYDTIFNNGIVAFAADDAVYHMRLVENLITNFPHKIWFEVFTTYPYGQPIHFGPLWTYIIAVTSLIIGMGSPSLELTRTVGAFMPGIFGALFVIPTYYIGKELFNKNVGLCSAIMIAIMPGQIFQRSALGFTDHHAGEVLFLLTYIMFLIMSLNYVNRNPISITREINIIKSKTFYDKINSIWHINKTLLYPILAGVSFGLYMLQWSNGVFFGGIVCIFFTIVIVRNHILDKPIGGICTIAVTSFFCAFPFMLIVFNPVNDFAAHRYSMLHILLTLGSAIIFLLLGIISTKLNEKNKHKAILPSIILGAFGISVILSRFVPLFAKMFKSVDSFFTIFKSLSGGGLTIGEASTTSSGMIAYNYPGIASFLSSYVLAIYGLILLVTILIFKKWNSAQVLFVIFSGTLLLLTFAQNRWLYYYSANVAILSSYLCVYLIGLTRIQKTWSKFVIDIRYKSTKEKITLFISSLKPLQIVSILLLIFILFLPNYQSVSRIAVGGIGEGYYEWYESMTWMRDNTPKTGLDFNLIYAPSTIKTNGYPESSYGVLSWWDYGHVITYFGERMANANPFQAGIGGYYVDVNSGIERHEPGASTFFTAKTEEEGNAILDELDTRYIVSCGYMAYSIQDVMAVWNNDNSLREGAIVNYANPPTQLEQYLLNVESSSGLIRYMNGNTITAIPSKNYYDTMESRLHIFDTNGLSHYRLIHESAINPYTRGGYSESYYKYRYNMYYGGQVSLEPTGYVKIFEYVKGATITGKSTDGVPISLSINIKTNDIKNDMFNTTGRTFTYSQSTTSKDGWYSFTVPYSTISPIVNGTKFDTKPVSPYVISYNGTSYSFDMPEDYVMEGKSVNLDLI